MLWHARETIDCPEAWIRPVSSRAAINWMKRVRGREVVIDPHQIDPPQGVPDHADYVVGQILYEHLFGELSQQQRQILELRFGQDLQRAVIADLLQVSEETVKTHLKRGIRNIRQTMEREGSG
jgi:RNA polymerase sigma-70 factor (ECF subfamily)